MTTPVVPTATGAGDIAPSPLPPIARENSLGSSEKGKDVTDVSHIPEERREAARQLAAMTPEEYAAYEKKILWKMDLNIIPWITLLYLISFLDRVNVGAARLVGLMEDLRLTPLMFSNISMIFFVSYVVFEVPSNLVLKKFRPSRWIPFTMVIWAIFQTCMGFVKTYEQLLALRFCLGIFEAGLFPGLNLYLTAWYRRDEINKRVAVFFAGAVLAGAFGGIFGFALGQMAGVGGLNGWSWIFIIEGLLTLVIGIASVWMVHDFPHEAKLLSPLEREFVLSRLQREQGLAGEGSFTKTITKKAFKDWKMYAMMLAYIGAGEPLYSLALFAPTIIASLGTFTRPQSLLLSTPPYVLCFITTIGTAILSDKYKRRAPFLIFWSSICAIGYILLAALPVSQPGVRYFAVFVATAGAGPMIATTISWTGNTWANHYKKAICMGMVFSAGNSGGIVASQVYQDAPRFIPGQATAISFCLCNLSMSVLMWWRFSAENKRRDAVYGPPPTKEEIVDMDSDEYMERYKLTGMTRAEIIELGDDHPAFRYVL